MSLRLELDVFGDVQLARELLRVGEHADDLAPAFRSIADYWRDLEREQFGSQGATGSGGWPPLAPSTIARKGHATILVDTETLRDSLTDAGDERHIEHVTSDELVFGTSVSYAKYHQRGTSRTPQRRPIELTDHQRRESIKKLQRRIMTGEIG